MPNDSFKEVIEAWNNSREQLGITLHYLLFDPEAGDALGVDRGILEYTSADNLAQRLSNATGTHIVAELVKDSRFPPGKAIWSRTSWDQWRATILKLEAFATQCKQLAVTAGVYLVVNTHPDCVLGLRFSSAAPGTRPDDAILNVDFRLSEAECQASTLAHIRTQLVKLKEGGAALEKAWLQSEKAEYEELQRAVNKSHRKSRDS